MPKTDLLNKKVSFVYKNKKDGKVAMRSGVVVKNGPNVNPTSHITLDEEKYRSFEISRIVEGTLRVED